MLTSTKRRICSSQAVMLGLCSIGNENSTECYNDTTIPWIQQPKRKFTVAVEGNIGSGKSTFLQHFQDSPNVEIYCEPVEMWKNVRGHNTLDLMYKDSKRWALTFQSYVQLTMLQVHHKKSKVPVKLMERSIWSAKYCFVENLYKSGRMPAVDFAVLSEWFDWIVKNANVNIDLLVYLRASPETCLERIKARNRKEESGVPLDYLETLHDLHEDWLVDENQFKLPAPVLVLDADKDLNLLKADFDKHRHQILCGYD